VAESLSRERIEQRREWSYRRRLERKIETPEEALQFVNQVGFCHFWPIKGAELPNLFEAIAGRARPVPYEHDDPDMSRCWRWKDEALSQGKWYYGKLLYRKATLASLDVLPVFYAASENLGDLHDYLDEYEAGLMTAEAKWIYEALLEHGPLHTIHLRQRAGLSGGSAKSRFDRGLVELQTGLKVLPVGVARAGHWKYAFTYDILQRHFPEVVEQARELKRSEAQQALVSQYLQNVVATDRPMVKRIFRVLKWTSTEMNRAIAALLEQGGIEEVAIEGLAEPQLVYSQALSGAGPAGG
jgi:hypothetical protein